MNSTKKCAVIRCDSNNNGNNSITFHELPTVTNIALKWLENLENMIPSLFEPDHQFYICEKHFENRFLLKSGTIADDAYPTLFISQIPDENKDPGCGSVSENIENWRTSTKAKDLTREINEHDYYSSKKQALLPPSIQNVNIEDGNTFSDNDDDNNNDDVITEIEPTDKPKTPQKSVNSGIKNITKGHRSVHLKVDKNGDLIDPTGRRVFQKIKDFNGRPAFRVIADGKGVKNNAIGDLKDPHGRPVFQIDTGAKENKNTTKTEQSIQNKRNNKIVDLKDTHGRRVFQMDPPAQKDSKSSVTHVHLHSVSVNKPNTQNCKVTKYNSNGRPVFRRDPFVQDDVATSSAEKPAPKTMLPTYTMHSLKPPKYYEKEYKACMKQLKKLKHTVKLKNERIKKLRFDRQVAFDKLTKHITNPLAKKFLWMQVRSTPKNSKANRFTEEEKIICVYIRNHNIQCYRMLSKIFNLPSTKTLLAFLKSNMKPKQNVVTNVNDVTKVNDETPVNDETNVYDETNVNDETNVYDETNVNYVTNGNDVIVNNEVSYESLPLDTSLSDR